MGAYFARVLPEGRPRIARAYLRQQGRFLVGPPRLWRPFRATQTLTTRPPGFVWDARIRMPLGLPIVVRDAFREGAGSMRARFLGLRLADVAGTPAIAAAALQRYLAEAVLLPTALLPSEGVSWTAIGASSARACIAAGTTRVSLEFRFGRDGLVESVFAPARMRDVKGRGEPTPWHGHWWDYEEHDGVLAPRSGEVAWELPRGRQPYWRGEVTRIEYEVD